MFNAIKLVCGSLVGAATLATAANAEKFIVTTNVPPTHWASSQGGVPFMECVTEATGGEIEFDYFHSGQIASFFESLDAVNNGLAQISYIVLSAQTDKLPLTGVTMLPGLGSGAVDTTIATRKVLGKDGPIRDEYTANRIVPLMINVFPPYQMISRGAPFDTLESLQGKKISTGGGTLMVTLAATGATAIQSPAGDIYLSLQQGAVDGTMLSITSITPYKLQEVTKSVSANGHFGVATGIWSIDSDVFSALSEDKQTAMRDCGLKVENELAAWADNWTIEQHQELRDAGMSVFDYSEEELAKIGVKLEEVRQDYVQRLEARGMSAQQAYDDYLEAISQ
ncbi:MAG: TRAP transporter substrate-binding protein DctP [Pseudorhodobacter sp.]